MIADGALLVGLVAISKDWDEPFFGALMVFSVFVGLLVGNLRFGLDTKTIDHLKGIGDPLLRYIVCILVTTAAVLVGHWTLMIPLLFLCGYQRRGFTPSLQTMVHDISPLPQINQALSLVFVALVIGAALGRALSGSIFEAFGTTAPLLLSALSVGIAYICWRILRRFIGRSVASVPV